MAVEPRVYLFDPKAFGEMVIVDDYYVHHDPVPVPGEPGLWDIEVEHVIPVRRCAKLEVADGG